MFSVRRPRRERVLQPGRDGERRQGPCGRDRATGEDLNAYAVTPNRVEARSWKKCAFYRAGHQSDITSELPMLGRLTAVRYKTPACRYYCCPFSLSGGASLHRAGFFAVCSVSYFLNQEPLNQKVRPCMLRVKSSARSSRVEGEARLRVGQRKSEVWRKGRQVGTKHKNLWGGR